MLNIPKNTRRIGANIDARQERTSEYLSPPKSLARVPTINVVNPLKRAGRNRIEKRESPNTNFHTERSQIDKGG
jgi:hypothetical protein